MRPIFFDTETTGNRPKFDRIVKIAALDPERGKTFEAFINPGIPIPAAISNIHGITDAMVANAKSFKEVGQKFIDFCDGDIVLIAHNLDNFDYPMFHGECTRNNLKIPEAWQYFDTLKWARTYRKDLPRHSLQFLRTIYEIKENNAHRALDDTIILYEVYKQMVDDLPCHEVLRLYSKRNGQPKVISTQSSQPEKSYQLF